MDFIKAKQKLQANFYNMTQDIEHLFEVEVDKEKLWNLYLDSFPEGTNPFFRERTEHDCSCCRQFIKTVGNVVAIKNGQVKTIWDVELGDTTYQPVFDALSSYVNNEIICNVYISKFKKIGCDKNYEQTDSGKVIEWSHFYLELPDRFVDTGNRSVGDIQGEFRDTKNVFKRSLDEITEDSVLTVLELIAQNSLYKGEEWKMALEEFLRHKKQYDKMGTEKEKDV